MHVLSWDWSVKNLFHPMGIVVHRCKQVLLEMCNTLNTSNFYHYYCNYCYCIFYNFCAVRMSGVMLLCTYMHNM